MTTLRRSTRIGKKKSIGFEVTELNPDNELKQAEVQESPDQEKPDVTEFIYQPRSIGLLLILISGLLYTALWHTSPTDHFTNASRGLLAAASAFIFIGVLQFGDGPFIRPHPVVWRFVLAISILYLLVLIVMLFQTVNEARKAMSWIDASLGVQLPEKSYADECSLTWDNLMDKLDMFVPAHLFGWVAKALILRDVWLCWVVSIMFEVMEYSLEFQLPNFGECWWDHWVLDVLICNWAGIAIGMWICRCLALKTYCWRSIKDIPTIHGKVIRSVKQLTPHSWTSFDWASTRTFKGYCYSIVLITFFLLSELNCFYLKALLWIPPPHWLNMVRVILHGLMGMVGVRELYQYLTDPKCKKLGAQLWVCLAVILVETLISIKFGINELPMDFPRNVVIFWSFFTAALIIFPIYKFWLLPRYYRHTKTSSS